VEIANVGTIIGVNMTITTEIVEATTTTEIVEIANIGTIIDVNMTIAALNAEENKHNGRFLRQ